MLKLVIIDDEATTRHGLRVCIDWEQYGIEIVGEADGGTAGIALAERLSPDIIITDVKMPGMDGIEMVRQLRSRFNKLKVIFISGYDDIEYVKQAMKFDAIDYILKPVNLSELLQVIQKVVEIKKEEQGQRDLLVQMDAKLRESMPLLRERFITQLLTDPTKQDPQLLKKRIEFLDIPLPLECDYCILVLSLDNKSLVLEGISQKELELISFTIQNICQDILKNQLPGYVIELRRGEYVLILPITNDREQDLLFSLVAEIKNKLSEFMTRFIQTSMTVGVGGCVHHLNDISYSYFMAMEAVQQKMFLGNDQIITIDDMETERSIDLRKFYNKVNAVPSLLKSGKEEKIIVYLNELFDELTIYRGISREYSRIVAVQILSGASHFLIEYEVVTKELEEQERQLWEQLFKLETINDIKHALASYLMNVCFIVGEKRIKKSHEVIERIKHVIKENYQESLTITEIANRVFFSSTYICLLFKQETGETINDYMTKIRIEKAKELLANTEYKLHDISVMIGYAEPGYFSKQFKRLVGFSPSDYRDIYANTQNRE